jgi:hypothetical protein
METARKRPSNEGRYRSDKADRVQQCSSDKTREHFTTMFCEVASGSRKRQLKVRKNTSQQCLASLKF